MEDSQDIIIEMIPQGKFVKVTAIHVKSGREVSIVGASSASQNELHRIAVNKLKYVMKRESESSKRGGARNKRGFEA